MELQAKSIIEGAEERRRMWAATAVGGFYLASTLALMVLGLVKGVASFVVIMGALACVLGAAIAGALRGHTRIAGYIFSLSFIGIVAVGPFVSGNPGYSSFYLVAGVVLAALILPGRDAFVIYALGLVAELAVSMAPVTAPELPTIGGLYLEGALLYAVTGLISVAMAASIGRLIDELLVRDKEARASAARAENLATQLEHSQRMEALGRLAGGIAHDFNNLLTVMQACSSLIESEIPAHSSGKRDLADLNDAVTRASAMTRQLLAFARRDVVPMSPIDLREVVSSTSDLLRRVLGRGIELEVNLAPKPCHVIASKSQLEQVLLNLAVNARDAMEGSGRISITVDMPDDRTSRLVVKDNGPGMSDDVRSHIFEPFFTTKGGRGNGLGLSTVYGVATRLGGQVSVDSSLGHGATFFVALPLTAPPIAPVVVEPAAPIVAKPSGGGLSVVIVDDEQILRSQLTRLLKTAGHRPTAFATAEEAFASVETVHADVVVSDVQLGTGADGLTFVRMLLSQKPNLKVIVMSGFTMEPKALETLVAQGVTFLPKPFTPDELLAVLAKVLRVAPS